ncbi:prealbumin-like fold domain-containing protein [Gardnerella sp. DNF01189]|uniref:SpaH/EbpB family LPXTG-anchored major pilin n=1 Tax=Gardnerella sp. DNF01189 TaxID=2749063 RepID=UPI003BABAF96
MRLQTSKLKRAVALVAASCTLGTCCIAGSIAWANGEQGKDGANVGNIDDTKKDNGTSITIHKYQSPATDTRSDGSNQSNLVKDKKPVKGVEFKVCKVTLKEGKDADAKKIDLSTAEGWKKIKDIQELDPSSATKNAASFLKGDNAKFVTVDTDCKKQTTGEDGSTKFDKLAESLYYVEESDTKGAQIKDAQGAWKPVTVTGKVDPFFITTPLPHKTANTWEWLYDVNVYPKNDTSDDVARKTPKTPTKLYTDDGDAIIPWDISMPLTPPSDNKAYKKIGFVDSLPEGLTYDSLAEVKLVKKGKATGSTASDVSLTENTDYKVETGTDKKKVTFSLSVSRLKTLSEDFSRSTYVLKVTLKTKVAKDTKNVTNSINGWIDDSKIGDNGDPEHPCVPTKEDPKKCDKNPHGTSHFATLKITKVNDAADKAKGKKPLKGAEFTVYPVKEGTKFTDVSSKNVTKETIDGKLDKGTNDANAIKLKATDDNGVTTANLFIGTNDVASKIYCVVETKAPAGFKLNETPTCYEVKVETKEQAAAGLNNDNAHEIVNSQATELDKILANLPMTGARGLVILTVCGIVGIAGTLFYVVMKRRKEQEQE